MGRGAWPRTGDRVRVDMTGLGPPADPIGGPSPAPLPGLPFRAGVWVSLTAGVLIAIAQVDRLIGQVPDAFGRTFEVTALTFPVVSQTAWRERHAGWSFLFQEAAADGRMASWLLVYALLDLVFILLYGLLIRSWGAHLTTMAVRVERPVRGLRWCVLALWCGLFADVLESAVMLGLRSWGSAPQALLALSTVKWAGLVVGAVSTLVWWSVARQSAPGPSTLRRTLKAAYTHRLSVLVLVPLVALGLPPGPDLVDQLPDIQRRWADAGGLEHFVWSGVLTLVAAGALFVLGRLRSHGVACRAEGTVGATAGPHDGAGSRVVPRPSARPVLWVWFAGPALVVTGGLVALLLGGHVGWGRVAVFCAVPLAIGLVSAWMRRHYETFLPDGDGWMLNPALARPGSGVSRLRWRKTKRVVAASQSRTTTRVGDGLAAVLFVVPGLGLVRSFTGVVALGPFRASDVGLLLAGIVMLIGGWPAAWLLQRSIAGGAGTPIGGWARAALSARMPHAPAGGRFQRAAGWARAVLTPGTTVEGGRWIAGVILALACILIVVLGAWTEPVTAHLGVLASLLLALIVLIGLLGASIVYFQDGGAPEIFWCPLLRLAAPPVTTLFAVAALLATTFGGGADVHGVRTLAGVPDDPDRHSLDRAFANWARGADCAVPRGGFLLRPMLLLAAEGGGIRAARWTAEGVDTLAADARRVARSGQPATVCSDVFMSSGASGGAVGLAVADTVPPSATAAAAVDAMAAPDALAAASVGMFLTDVVYAATGVPLLTADAGRWRWFDRAGHMERAWERAVPPLASSFTGSPDGRSLGEGPAGLLVLNSTSSTTLCRTLVGQALVTGPNGGGRPAVDAASGGGDPALDLARGAAAHPLECTLAGQPPASADLLDIAAQCGQYLSRATAAMLAARFPYVTPTGVVCGREADTEAEETRGERNRTQQIVDGGYLENTGIGTIVDLAPAWLPALRRHNDCVLGAAASGAHPPPECSDGTLVVPVLVYLDNGTGADLAAPEPARQMEPVVPLVTGFRARGALSRTDAQLRRAEAAFAVEQLWTVPGSVTRAGTAAASAAGEAPGRLPADAAAAVVRAWRPRAVHLVYQATEPMIAAPLGWVLSTRTTKTLTTALDKAAGGDNPCVHGPDVPVLLKKKGYRTFAELRCMLAGRESIPVSRPARTVTPSP